MCRRIWKIILIFVILGSPISTFAQQKNKTTEKEKTLDPKLISAGVVNGRAINLVKPKYPKAALILNMSGTVTVEIIIDEKGNVSEAKATNGIGFLKRGSVKAALQSKFVPFKLSGKPLKVRGLIIYNYVPLYYNWLEIGYSIKEAQTWANMPSGFENQKAFFEIYQKSQYEDQQIAFDNLIASIESKLIEDEKSFWLFRVGNVLRTLQYNCCRINENVSKIASKLDSLMLKPPKNVSENLLIKLRNMSRLLNSPDLNTYNQIGETKLNMELKEIRYSMPMLGR